MKGPHGLSTPTAALLTIAVGREHPASRVAAQRPQIPAIRPGITMVPVDVRADYVKAVAYDRIAICSSAADQKLRQ